MTGPITGSDLTRAAVIIPAAGLVMLLTLFALRALLRAVVHLIPAFIRTPVGRLLEPVLRLLPPKGRTTRTLTWVCLFTTLAALLLVPITTDPFAPASATRIWTIDLGRWLVALAIAVSALCAAVAAWEPSTRSAAWAGLLGIEVLSLAAVTTTSPGITLLALDAAMLLAGLMLTFWSVPDGPLLPQLRRAVRSHLLITLIASVFCWTALYLATAPTVSITQSSTRIAATLLTVGLLLRCGTVPCHLPFLDLHTRPAGPLAMLLTGALVPAALTSLTQLAPQIPHGFGTTLIVLGLLGFVASVREPDLRRAVGRWTSATVTLAAGTILTLSPVARGLHANLLIIGVTAAATMLTFITHLIENDAGHREISRLRGLAARSPGAFGWIVLAALLLVGAPPGAAFTAALLHPDGYPIAAALALAIGTACTIPVIHRTFLGLPRTPDTNQTPLDLTARERLVLILLLTISLAATTAPTTWLRQ